MTLAAGLGDAVISLANQSWVSTFHFGQATPNTKGFSNGEGMFVTALANRTNTAYSFCLDLSSLTLFLPLEGRGWEEEIGMVATA